MRWPLDQSVALPEKSHVNTLAPESVAPTTRRAKHLKECQGRFAKIFLFPEDGSYDLTNPARLDTGDVMAIRHQT
jgi:hypothetical protein